VTGLALRPYQREGVNAVFAEWRRGVRRTALVWATGLGKGHTLDTEIPTPVGMRQFGDLGVGDLVYGSDGQPTRIIGVFDRGLLPTYRVTFNDLSGVEVDGDHLWAVRTRSDKSKGRNYRVFTTSVLAERLGSGLYIPMTAPVAGGASRLPVDPYVLGVLLGDGSLSIDESSVRITCQRDTMALVATRLPAGCVATERADAGGGAADFTINTGTGRRDNPVLSGLRALGLMGCTAHDKFVPEIYLNAGPEDRLALIQGMCDTDGHVPPGFSSVDWTSVSYQLAVDMQSLVTSLGGVMRLVHKRTTWTHLGERRHGWTWRGNVRLPSPLMPVLVSRKSSVFRVRSKYEPTRRIVSIDRVGTFPIRCITVEAADHLYLVTRQHLVTHNTVAFSQVAAEHLAATPGGKVLALAHTTELVDQMIAKFHSVSPPGRPGVRVGRVQGTTNQTLAQVVCASVQTLRSEARRRMIRGVTLVIVDEAHHAVASTYLAVLRHFGCMDEPGYEGGRALALGCTATMMRADDKALGAVWQSIAHQRTIAEGIADGFLVRPTGLHVQVDDLDLSAVKVTAGDYRKDELGKAIEDSLAPEAIVKAVAEHADRRKILLFAPTVSSAEVIGDALRASGRSVGLVHGGLAEGPRKAVLDAYRAGETQVLANCMVLTEGFDHPAADCAVIARPTRSKGLYIQIAGRVLRPWPGKTDALLLDVVGATTTHSLMSGVTLFGDRPDGAQPAQKAVEASEWDEPEEDLAPGQQDARQALGLRDGPLVATEVDLFAGSTMAWLRTRAGVFFIEAGERYIAIMPAAPRRAEQWMAHFSVQNGPSGSRPFVGYDVVSVAKRGPAEQRSIVRGVEDLSYAMAWAEGDVSPTEKTTATKERSWRAKPPSDKLRALADKLRVYVPPGAKSGEVSNMVSLVLASKRIDPLLQPWSTGR
jgi:superfamily II DNA or RNA helicase